MSNKLSCRQRGYALPEVLIATVIAAGVLTAAASAIGGMIRLDRASSEQALHLAQAETIAARLRAGVTDEQALEGFNEWTVERQTAGLAVGDAQTPFERIFVTKIDKSAHFEILAPRAPNQ